jgi:hypothetical protein
LNSQAWTGVRAIDYRCLCKDMFFFGEYLTALSFLTTKNLALYDGAQIFWLDRQVAKGIDFVLELDGLEVSCKDALGANGQGIFFIESQ